MPESRPRRAPSLRERVLELGALRVALLVAVGILSASALFSSSDPFADAAGTGGASPYLHAPFGTVWASLVAPPLAVMMAFVVPLDMLMSRIYMADKEGTERARYRRILAAEALAIALLIAVWTPFFASLLSL